MARYLFQDHRFLDSFLVLLSAARASADTFAARLRFGRFIGMVSAESSRAAPPAATAVVPWIPVAEDREICRDAAQEGAEGAHGTPR